MTRCLLLAVCLPLVAAAQEDLTWHEEYAPALAEAQATGKPLFLEFRCSP